MAHRERTSSGEDRGGDTLTKKADAPPGNDPVRLALELPAATAAADPYYMTFALIRLAKAQHAAGDVDAAYETFRLADKLADTVKNEHLRRLASCARP